MISVTPRRMIAPARYLPEVCAELLKRVRRVLRVRRWVSVRVWRFSSSQRMLATPTEPAPT